MTYALAKSCYPFHRFRNVVLGFSMLSELPNESTVILASAAALCRRLASRKELRRGTEQARIRALGPEKTQIHLPTRTYQEGVHKLPLRGDSGGPKTTGRAFFGRSCCSVLQIDVSPLHRPAPDLSGGPLETCDGETKRCRPLVPLK